MIYSVINKETQQEVYRYSADQQIEWEGMSYATHDHIALPENVITTEPTTVYGGRRRISKLDFIELLGQPAYQAILSMSHVSVAVESEVKKFELAAQDIDGTSVYLDDIRTISFVQSIGSILESQGVVAHGWSEEVLNG